jgi:hypothetical protein
MRFSAATIFGLAASATAAVLPRSQLGSWDVSVLKTAAANGYNSQSVTAVYTSDETTEPITKKCSYAYNPTVEPKESNSCDEGFSATYDGTSTFSPVSETSMYTLLCRGMRVC